MCNRVQKYLDDNIILNEKQYGFRSKHNTTTALHQLLNYVTTALDKNQFVSSVFLDLAKAFDSLNHKIVCRKLEYYGSTVQV